MEAPAFGLRETSQTLPEAPFGVPANEVAVDPGEIVAVGQRRRQRPLADMRLAGGHDLPPTLLPGENRQPTGELVGPRRYRDLRRFRQRGGGGEGDSRGAGQSPPQRRRGRLGRGDLKRRGRREHRRIGLGGDRGAGVVLTIDGDDLRQDLPGRHRRRNGEQSREGRGDPGPSATTANGDGSVTAIGTTRTMTPVAAGAVPGETIPRSTGRIRLVLGNVHE